MSTPGEINSNFYQIVDVDIDGNPTQVKPQYITINTIANSNYANFAGTAYNVSVANVSGIGNIATVNLNGNSLNYLQGTGSWGPVVAANANYANIAGTAYNVSGSNVTGYVPDATHATIANTANVAYSVNVGNVVGIGNIATINKNGSSSQVLYGNGVFANIPTVNSVANANYSNFAGTAYSVSGSNVTGIVGNATHANVSDSANSVAVANVVGIGNIATVNLNGNSSTVLLGNGSWGSLGTTANANYANYAGTAFSVSVSNVSGIGNIATINLDGNVSNILHGNGYWGPETTSVANANYANFAGNVTVAAQPNITSVGNLVGLQFNNTVTPVVTPNIGEMFWDTGEHTVTLGMENGVKQQIGLESYIYVKASSAITNGQVVMFTGGSGNNVEAAPADVTSINFRPGYVLGLATQDIALNGFGYITTFGVVHGLNTNAYNVGDLLWLNPSVVGGLTNTEPAAPNYQIQIGTVNKKSGGDGHIQVIIRINPKLEDISDVTLTSPTSGQALILDGGNVWVNGNPNVANYATTVTGNTQSNITSLGTLSSLSVSGDTTISGNLTVGGTTEYTNVNNLYIKDPIIQLGGGANNTALTSNDGKDRGTLLNYFTTTPVSAFMGWDNSNAEFGFGSNVTNSSEVITFNSYGNIRADYYYGNGSQLTGIVATSGNANYSNYAGVVTTNSQPNITSTGTLASLTIAANGNITLSGTASRVTGANAVSATYLTGTLTTGAQPNITSTGTLANTTLAANATLTLSGTGSQISGANLISGTYLTGTLTTGAQPNITSTGTLTSLTVTGNTTSGNIISSGFGNVANVLFTKYNETVVAGGNTGAATLTPNAAAGTIYNYTVTGNITLSTLTNAVAGTSMVVILTQGGAGSFTLTSTMKFAGGSKTLSTAVGAIDIISIFYDGSTYYATLSKGYA
jgi:hypothetical protein